MFILFKFPTRSRPHIFRKTLDLYYDYIKDKNNFKFLISADSDDSSMNNPDMISYLESKPNLEYRFGVSKSKVEACNRDLAEFKNFDILVLVSDDMCPVVKGFDNIIRNKMLQYFPDTDGVLHFWDGRHEETKNTITLTIMGKKYYDRFNYIYHPSYTSLFCDNEQTDVAKLLNKYVYFDEVIIQHKWCSVDYIPFDDLYRKNESYYLQDKKVYEERRRYNFYV